MKGDMWLKALAFITLTGFAVGKQNFTQGFAVSADDKEVDFPAAYNAGARFVSIRATQGATTVDRLFKERLKEARTAGLLAQAYHTADPRESSGKEQFIFFTNQGGDWRPEVNELAGVLDIPPNPDPEGDPCYGLESDELTDWIRAWGRAYWEKYRAYSTIRTTVKFWHDCTYPRDWLELPTLMQFEPVDYESHSLPYYYPEPFVWHFWENEKHYEYGGRGAVFKGSYDGLHSLTTKDAVYPCYQCNTG